MIVFSYFAMAAVLFLGILVFPYPRLNLKYRDTKHKDLNNQLKNKKYKLTNEFIDDKSGRLYRIEALVDFHTIVCPIKAGTKGGFVQSEENLSQDDNCWVFDDAIVCENARVYGNAIVFKNAKVYGNAMVFDDALIGDDAVVFGNAKVYDKAQLYTNTMVYCNAKIYGKSHLDGSACVRTNAKVYNATIYDEATIEGNAEIYGWAVVGGSACVEGNAKIYGNAVINNWMFISHDADISSNNDFMYLYPIGPKLEIENKRDSLTAFRCKDGTIRVNNGNVCNTLSKFKHKVLRRYKGSKYEIEYLLTIKLIHALIN